MPDALLTAHVEARGGELARLVPELADRVALPPSSSNDGESERYLLFGAVLDLLARVSAVTSVVLLLDDLHWSDRQSVQLLRHVVSADAPLRLLVIGTFRESDVGTDHPLAEALAALHRESGIERIALRGLGDDELLTLLETTAGHQMTEDGVALRDALMAETEGNPFFVGEMLRHLAETGAIYQDTEGRWVASPDLRTSGLPVSIREVVGRRVARLGEQPQRVLSLAAVIGREFDTGVLAGVAELDEDAVIDLCDQAVAAAVLTVAEVTGRYRFAHALVEHTLYDGLSPSRRARSHQRVADALERLYGEDPGERVGELAYHWAHATQPRDAEKAMVYAQLAGDRALAMLAPDEALRWYRDALDLLDRAPADDLHRRAALLLGLGDAQRLTGDAAHRETLLAAAALADDIDAVDLLVRATAAKQPRIRQFHRWDRPRTHRDGDTGARPPRRRRQPRPGPPARTVVRGAHARHGSWTDGWHWPPRRSTWPGEQATGPHSSTPSRYATRPSLLPRTLELRRGWTSEACGIVDELADPTARLFANSFRMLTALEAGDLATMSDAYSIYASEVERVGQPLSDWTLAYNRHGDGRSRVTWSPPRRRRTRLLRSGRDRPTRCPRLLRSPTDQRALDAGPAPRVGPLIDQAVKDNPGIPAFRAVLVMAKSHDDADNEVSHLLDVEVANRLPDA